MLGERGDLGIQRPALEMRPCRLTAGIAPLGLIRSNYLFDLFIRLNYSIL
jgi:hypothetical protein